MNKLAVLRLYRRILTTARQWTAASGLDSDTKEERAYIRNEARSFFRKNSKITDDKEIETCIKEAETRLEMALHYHNPYPRPVNLPFMAVPQALHRKAQLRRLRESKPVYLHSQLLQDNSKTS
ncbi:LYR motif containing protein 1-like [Corticium candelabrum]|uniref:LYR motif containing protein 1-like n=1 Tax=Corticium candelabrum TaxID=121492 RepID=UPI002E37667A|nr:LYR motif containing protein 1-like [Corticium candelabrum]